MDVSNGTGEGTDYRTGSGVPKEVTWTHLPDKKILHCADPKAPFTIWFRLKSGKVLSATYDQPMESVSLVRSGSGYKINSVKKKVEKPTKKPAPPARTTTKKNAA
jgi:hypothetical protein